MARLLPLLLVAALCGCALAARPASINAADSRPGPLEALSRLLPRPGARAAAPKATEPEATPVAEALKPAEPEKTPAAVPKPSASGEPTIALAFAQCGGASNCPEGASCSDDRWGWVKCAANTECTRQENGFYWQCEPPAGKFEAPRPADQVDVPGAPFELPAPAPTA